MRSVAQSAARSARGIWFCWHSGFFLCSVSLRELNLNPRQSIRTQQQRQISGMGQVVVVGQLLEGQIPAIRIILTATWATESLITAFRSNATQGPISTSSIGMWLTASPCLNDTFALCQLNRLAGPGWSCWIVNDVLRRHPSQVRNFTVVDNRWYAAVITTQKGDIDDRFPII